MTPVTRTAPVAPWLGGKRNLAKRICATIDATPCGTYAEPFVGMGGIFLRRSARPKAEVINDKGRDIANLFRILQRHYPQFLDTLRFQLTTRAEFNRLVDTNPETLTDLERAARFLYLQRTAFGGKVSGRNFGVSKDRPGRFNLTTLEPMLEDLHSRLAGVVIECLDWSDFAAMADQLRTIKGRFLMSINDVPEIRALFAWARIEEVSTTYTIGNHSERGTDRAELLISKTP